MRAVSVWATCPPFLAQQHAGGQGEVLWPPGSWASPLVPFSWACHPVQWHRCSAQMSGLLECEEDKWFCIHDLQKPISLLRIRPSFEGKRVLELFRNWMVLIPIPTPQTHPDAEQRNLEGDKILPIASENWELLLGSYLINFTPIIIKG